ncbi:unnamed protein product [Heterobilharzia americana]|nr:unnamed protein product [Heterobilharzia americana]
MNHTKPFRRLKSNEEDEVTINLHLLKNRQVEVGHLYDLPWQLPQPMFHFSKNLLQLTLLWNPFLTLRVLRLLLHSPNQLAIH